MPSKIALNVVTRIADDSLSVSNAVDEALQEVREVLAAFSTGRRGERCWCVVDPRVFEHSERCKRARGLMEKLAIKEK